MKFWEKNIEKKIREGTTIGEKRIRFMPGKSKTDVIFALRQLLEKYLEKRLRVHTLFIDMEKTYDREEHAGKVCANCKRSVWWG